MPKAYTMLSMLQKLVSSASLKSCAPVPTRRLPRSRRHIRTVSGEKIGFSIQVKHW